VADRQNLSADDPVNRRNPATSTKSKSKFTEQRLLYLFVGCMGVHASSVHPVSNDFGECAELASGGLVGFDGF
jgi:hypothetical protein